jgi:tRNA (guanine37-N1)-methyltransferase
MIILFVESLKMAFKITVLTLFPELFPGPLGVSITGKALENGIWEMDVVNIRDFATDRHKTVDDTPAGGGAGMVMKPDILGQAIESCIKDKSKIIYLSPRGRALTQEYAKSLSKEEHLILICGRYEGIDQRILDEWEVEEVSIGDYVLTGGEIPAFVLMDACVRLQEGVVGDSHSLEEESFSNGLLEYPHYTRPSVWKNRPIPEILMSGHHEKIKRWRQEQSVKLTQDRRPDLWLNYLLKEEKSHEYFTKV